MEGTDQEIQAKQNLLQTEIIEKNLDKGSFINFCLSKKENGDDLNNWNLQELKKIIEEFTLTQKEKEDTLKFYEVKELKELSDEQKIELADLLAKKALKKAASKNETA